MSKKEIEKKYNVDIFKDFGFDNSTKYWVAVGKENGIYAEAYTLKELLEILDNSTERNK